MHENNRTEIATLGEFGLIKHLTQDIKLETRKVNMASATMRPYWNFRKSKCW